MKKAAAAGCLLLTLVSTACGASYTETRIGEPRSPRPESCEIEWISIDAKPASKHVDIAMLSNMNVGPDPSSAQAREQVRRRACALGGDAVSLVRSSNDLASYIVWANKPSQESSAP
jgi:hypothetical protein